MKIIKLDDEVHARLTKHKEEFTETIGFRFTLSDTVREYQKIINIHKDAPPNNPPLQNSPRLPLEKSEDKQTCDFNEAKQAK